MLTQRKFPAIITNVAAKRCNEKNRGVAQFGRALRSGRRGRGFKSRHLDHLFLSITYRGVAQFGRALRSGRRGRGFKSRHLDQ